MASKKKHQNQKQFTQKKILTKNHKINHIKNRKTKSISIT